MSKQNHRERVTRRAVLKGTAAAGVAIAGAPMVARGLIRQAKASSKPGVIRFRAAGTTATPGDWSRFEKETGLKMEASVEKDDTALFINDVINNDAGDRFDLFLSLAGAQQPLQEGGFILPVDASRLKNWAGVSQDVRDMPLLKPVGGQNWGVPIYMNADSFGYFAGELNEPRPPGEVSWDLAFNSEKTLGRVSLDDNFFTLSWAGAYLKVKGLAPIDDPANMTAEEVRATADFLIERKRAGQFRNLWATFDDQVANFVNHEVLVQRSWEPAVNEAQRQGLDVHYAAVPNDEFYIKWMQAAFIPAQAEDRNLDEIYTAIDWLLSGSYAAQLTPLRGYVTSRPDLGLELAKAEIPDAVPELEKGVFKINKKFATNLFWFSGLPDTLQEHQQQMERFKNA